jgi:signal transduction histidine kinase
MLRLVLNMMSAVTSLTHRLRAPHEAPGDASESESLRTRYGWAVVVPVVLVALLSAVAGEDATLFLFVLVLGVGLVAIVAGLGPALLATFLSLAACAYLLEPTRSIGVSAGLAALRLAGFGAVSLAMAWAVGSLRASYRRAARQQVALERAVRLRDEVLAVVSHDLKAPLGAIRLSGDALTRLAARTPEVGRHAARIVSSTEHMERLIHDLLDAASIDAGRLSVERMRQSAEDVAREALDRVQAAADAAGVRVSLAVAGGGPFPVSCDRGRILQALGNLLVNAVNATARGGSVTLEVRSAPDAVVLGVRDTGIGIDPDELPHLFDRFRRGRTARYRGSGLGLTIAKGIAEAHGGSIRVESRPGEGSLFELVLPQGERA